MKKRKIKIAIVDSGISQCKRTPFFKEKVTIVERKCGEIGVEIGAEDRIGHGTAVASLIALDLHDVEYYMVKIFEESMYASEQKYLKALEYCVEEINPQIIHLSNGITCCENLGAIRDICTKAANRGILIIAAFDNFGALSYPAAFDNVIGVDVSNEVEKGYVLIETAGINIVVPNLTHKVEWTNNVFFVSNGTSFNACLVTRMVAHAMLDGYTSVGKIIEYLKDKSLQTITLNDKVFYEKKLHIKEAVLFPFNKELHSFVRFQKYLPFKIQQVYDIKYLRKIGQLPEEFLKIERDEKSLPIRSFEQINWDASFDTFIVGHVKEIEIYTKRDYIHEIAEKCLENSKSLISLGDFEKSNLYAKKFEDRGLSLYIPRITKRDVPNLFRGKLRSIGVPVIGIFGTSSQQGKFTLQVELRNYFIKQGYKVGQLGTEPTSLLFGFDEVYPIGYESTVEVSGRDEIAVINNMMGRIEDKNPDIIIVGSQSQTIPQCLQNLSLLVLEQHNFLLATEPDAIVLCVNLFDDEKYIERTIRYIEALVDARVIALSVFPMKRTEMGGILTNKLLSASKSDIESARNKLEQRFNRKVFVGGESINELGEVCINYFSREC